MTSEIGLDAGAVVDALARAGQREETRNAIFELLRNEEAGTSHPSVYRETVRWPLIVALMRDTPRHRVVLSSGLAFDIGTDSRIEKALLLSATDHPDHVWEPQTTKLLVQLATGASNVVVGGAYIGDHVLPMARAMGGAGTVHAFEPMTGAFERLVRNLEINGIHNVVANQLGLWDRDDVTLGLAGDLALASSVEVDPQVPGDAGETVLSVSLSHYMAARELSSVDLIMLDTEGGEERALLGAHEVLGLDVGRAPNIVFEVHRDFIDWTPGLENTSIVKLLRTNGYEVFAIRDIHDNYPMAGQPVEIVPVESVYVDGPPHGFNMLAVKDTGLVDSLGLQIVEDVSPKLIPEKDPRLHHPRAGFARDRAPAAPSG